MKIAFTIALLALTACGKNDPKDVTYTVYGTSVVLDEGVGPDEPEMLLAVELYRQGAESRWLLETAEEQALWGLVAEIRWTDDSVPDGGMYQDRTLLLHWNGCAVRSELYRLLTRHYRGADTTDEDLAWARDLAVQNAFICQG